VKTGTPPVFAAKTVASLFSSKRIGLIFAGIVLLLLAGLANWDTQLLYSDAWRVHLRGPGSGDVSFPIWWLAVGLPLVPFLVALARRGFRQRVFLPLRKPSAALPVVLVALFLVFSLFPWEFSWIRPSRSHITLNLVLGSCGFILLMAGIGKQGRYRFRRENRWCPCFPRMNADGRPGLTGRAENRDATVFAAKTGGVPVFWAVPTGQFLLIAAGFVFVAANLISGLVFEHVPHVPDSIAQLFQARIFAAGKLSLSAPHWADFFDYEHVIADGRWYSQYPFLHSLLLVPGVLAGVPWLINPLLGALFVPVLYWLGREVYDEQTARLSVLLACLSPLVLAMSSEYMNHASALLFATLFMLFAFRMIRTAQWRQGLFAGLFLGLVADIRPFTALLVAAPFVLYGLILVFRQPGRYAAGFLLALVGAALAGSLVLLYNYLTNGNALVFGYVAKYGPGLEIGFGKSGWGLQHTPLRGLVNTGHNLNLVNKYLFEWPIPALLPLGVLVASGTRDWRDWLLLGAFLSLLVGHFFYWHHGLAFGPRVVYEAAGALMLLTIRGFQALGEFLRRAYRLAVSDAEANVLSSRIAVFLMLGMFVLGLPPMLKGYRGYFGVDARLVHEVRRQGLTNALVFCPNPGDVFNANKLTLDGSVVYAQDLGVLNPALTLAYPGRSCWQGSKGRLAPLPNMNFRTSRLRVALDSLAGRLSDSLLADYRTLIWPFRDLPPSSLAPRMLAASSLAPALPQAGEAWHRHNADKRRGPAEVNHPQVTDFRTISIEVTAGRKKLEDYLPALACWLVKDPRLLLGEFSYMDKSVNFVSGDVQFTRLATLPDASGTIYDIRMR
jgi:hypothetical protein